jgi:dihydrofolate synthase/folylpolyglutamate synthase
MVEACRRLSNPEKTFPIIHVAGTNGKGSVCTKIAEAFHLSGYRVGLFTSPHISSYAERFQINHTNITPVEVVEGVRTIQSLCAPDLTFFEISTLLCFWWFNKKKVDVAVLEVGLGGRLDATNICEPQLAVITSISFDHTQFLGTTLEEITREKAGIIKEKTPVIVGPRVPLPPIFDIAKKKCADVLQVQGEWDDYDDENSAVATAALTYLAQFWAGLDRSIQKAVKVLPPCRFSVFEVSNQGISIPVVMDVAHNPDGITRLLMKAKKSFPKRAFVVLFAACKDKEVEAMVAKLERAVEGIVCTEARSSRAMAAQEIASLAKNMEIVVEPEVEKALERAIEMACQKEALLLITGTFFFMGHVRSALGLEKGFSECELQEVCSIERIVR